MKKILVVLCAVLLLCGCKAKTVDEEVPIEVETTNAYDYATGIQLPQIEDMMYSFNNEGVKVSVNADRDYFDKVVKIHKDKLGEPTEKGDVPAEYLLWETEGKNGKETYKITFDEWEPDGEWIYIEYTGENFGKDLPVMQEDGTLKAPEMNSEEGKQ